MYYVLSKGRFTVAAIAWATEGWRVSCPAIEFLKVASDNPSTAASGKAYCTMFERLAEQGPACLSSAMLHEVSKAESVFQLIKGDLRLLCFIDGATLYLTNGYVKKTQKADRGEVAKAIRARKEFFSQR